MSRRPSPDRREADQALGDDLAQLSRDTGTRWWFEKASSRRWTLCLEDATIGRLDTLTGLSERQVAALVRVLSYAVTGARHTVLNED